MEVEAHERFSSADEFCKFMPYQLSYSPPAELENWWVFWSSEDNELHSILRSSYPSGSASSIPISRNETIKINQILQHVQSWILSDVLVQFWAPVRIEDKVYLTCADQPFALRKLFKGFCFYRRLCLSLENILIPVSDVHNLGSEEYHFGPVGRAFRHGWRELCSNLHYCLTEEYPQRDLVLQFGLRGCMTLPLFESAGLHCIGVLEIVSIWPWNLHDFMSLKYVDGKFELRKNLPCRHHDYEDSEAEAEARRVLKNTFQRHHQLRYAQIWAAHLDQACIKVIGTVYDDEDGDFFIRRWLEMCEGVGVVAKAISSEGACFCKDVSNLSINVLPWVPLARELGLSGSFAICLKSSRVNAFYILELFFHSEIDFGDTKIFLRKLVVDLRKDIDKTENSPFQKIEERLSVEVIKISPGQDEIDSFEICTTGSPPLLFDHPGQGVMMQLEFSMEMEANEGCFSSGDEVCNFMPYQLSYSGNSPWVFWSSEANELQSILRYSCPSVYAFPISRNETIKEKIKLLLQSLKYNPCDGVVQFWAPVRIADKDYLTCADQPFALGKLDKRVYSYRRLCLCMNNILIPVSDVRDLGSEEHHVVPVGRAFMHGWPKFFHTIRSYLTEEYPQRGWALQLGFRFYCALPLFESAGLHCIGVLEMISTSRDQIAFWYAFLKGDLEEMDLRIKTHPDPHDHISSFLDSEAAEKARGVMQNTLRRHRLPLRAHMWAARLDKTCISLVHCDNYTEEIICSGFKKGQGVIGKAFSSLSACFCKDVTKLSIDVLPWVRLARELRLSGCFAMCLKNSRVNEFYILEFLFPSRMDYGGPKTFIAKLVTGLKKDIEELENSPIQTIEEKLSVEVINVSSDQDELDSFEICTTGSLSSLSDHSVHDEMMQHGLSHQQFDDTNDARPDIDCTIQTDVIGSNQEGRLTEPGGARNKCRAIRTLNVEYEITHEVLLQHSGKKLKDVEKALGVSRSTLKRICRKYGIGRWPPKRSKGPNKSGIHEDIVPSAANENTNVHNIPNSTTIEEGGSIMVKATYGENLFKFQLSLSAKKTDLEQQVAKRLNPSVGSFRIKYLDEENEWVSVACNEDLKLCIDVCKLLGKTTIRMSIN